MSKHPLVSEGPECQVRSAFRATLFHFITHDFGIVARVCDRVAVMYAGKIVEQADVFQLFDHPAHPYTKALLKSVPDLDQDVEYPPSIEGQPPTPDDLPPACSFAPRCPYAFDRCVEYPPQFTVGPGHLAACWRHLGAN